MSKDPASKEEPRKPSILNDYLGRAAVVRFHVGRVEQGLFLPQLPEGLDYSLESSHGFFVYEKDHRIYVAPIISDTVERCSNGELFVNSDIPVAPRMPRPHSDTEHFEAYRSLREKVHHAQRVLAEARQA